MTLIRESEKSRGFILRHQKELYKLFCFVLLYFIRCATSITCKLSHRAFATLCCCGDKPLSSRSLNNQVRYLYGLPVSLFVSYCFSPSAEPWRQDSPDPTLLMESSWKPSISTSCLQQPPTNLPELATGMESMWLLVRRCSSAENSWHKEDSTCKCFQKENKY